MYTDDEQKSSLPIKTFILSLILIIIFILLLMWLLPLPKNSNNNGNNNSNEGGQFSNLEVLTNRIFNSNVQDMKNAATSYFTTDKLPANVGDSKKLTLQEMLDMKLLLPFTDKNGNSCSTDESYVLLTKGEDSYEMKVNLKCDDQEDYILVTMGCYSYCASSICEKEKEPTPDKPVDVKTNPTCSLYVSKGTLDKNGLYTGDVVVSFRSKTATSKGATILTYGMGNSILGTYNKKDTYTVTKNGTTTVYGYVKDSNGKVGICSIVVKKNTPSTPTDPKAPSCSLYVASGSVGNDGTYTGNVVVKFKSKNVNASGASIKAYGLGTSTKATYNSNNTYTVTGDGTTTVYGYVKDSNGKTAICSLTVKKSTPPTPTTPTDPNCSLYVSSGTVGDNGWYVSDVVVKFKSKDVTTKGATISSYGIGTDGNVNYNKKNSIVVNKDGTTTVYGYVKDSNGKTAICSINVKRDTVKPTCELSVISGVKGANGNYISNVVVGLTSNTDKTSGVSKYGVSESIVPIYNKNTKYTISKDGNHTVYGYVLDKAGHVSKCDIKVKREIPDEPVISEPSCTLKVTNGTVGDNGWYKGNVTIGFASKTTTNGATIKSYGIGTVETYAGNSSYTLNADGTTTVYGYVKDSNGYTSTCSITLKKDSTKPSCTLKVLDGTYNQGGYYTSDITVGFTSRTDVTSGISKYGIGTTTNYSGNTTYKITNVGKYTIYGYVMDNAGNTAICDITVEKKSNLEYQYKKDISNQYSNWSDWSTYTYNPSNPPAFGKYTLIEIEDLGKTQEVDYYKESTGQPFYQYKTVKVGTATQEYCKGYNYYRDSKTVTTTYVIEEGTYWKHTGMVSTTGWPTDTLAVKYEFVGFDWTCTGCESSPKKIWNKYGRTVGTASSSHSVTTSKITVECAETEIKEVEIFDTVKVFVDYEIIKTPVYKDVYKYRQRTRTLEKKAYTDYQWSIYNDRNLLDNGYSYTGNTRVVG